MHSLAVACPFNLGDAYDARAISMNFDAVVGVVICRQFIASAGLNLDDVIRPPLNQNVVGPWAHLVQKSSGQRYLTKKNGELKSSRCALSAQVRGRVRNEPSSYDILLS